MSNIGWGKDKPTTRPGDKGPIDSNDLYGFLLGDSLLSPKMQFRYKSDDIECVALPGTDGMEDKIMSHCRRCINKKISFLYIPLKNDCHAACDQVLSDLAIDAPRMDRLNENDWQKIMNAAGSNNSIW
jgi:hypothetical protein